jgi:hypothetical protein
MHTLDGFRSRHAELKHIIGALEPLLDERELGVKPNAKTAYRLLCELADKLRAMLAEEDKGLYPSLLIHEDPKVKSIAWGFISGEQPVRKLFNAYHHRWLRNCDFRFDEAFLHETREIFALILDRIEREERLLFPKLEEIRAYREEMVERKSQGRLSAGPE